MPDHVRSTSKMLQARCTGRFYRQVKAALPPKSSLAALIRELLANRLMIPPEVLAEAETKPPSIDSAEVWRLASEEHSEAEIARRLECSPSGVNRILKGNRQNGQEPNNCEQCEGIGWQPCEGCGGSGRLETSSNPANPLDKPG